MFETGWLTLGTWRGVPIRVHWTVALGALIFGGFRFAPGAWIGFFLIVLLHELGHAYLVHRRNLRTVAVSIHGFGGECRYGGRVTELDRAVIAWGGVLAQALVLAAVLVLGAVIGPPSSMFTAELRNTLITTNLILIGLNLLPFPPLDGAEAWRLPKLMQGGASWRSVWASRRPGGRKPSKARKPKGTGRGAPGATGDTRDRAKRVVEDALKGVKGGGKGK
jgi:hypothetical protein